MFARDQWICRICGDSFLYSDLVRRHIAEAHDETMPPSQHEYWKGAEWQRKHKEKKNVGSIFELANRTGLWVFCGVRAKMTESRSFCTCSNGPMTAGRGTGLEA